MTSKVTILGLCWPELSGLLETAGQTQELAPLQCFAERMLAEIAAAEGLPAADSHSALAQLGDAQLLPTIPYNIVDTLIHIDPQASLTAGRPDAYLRLARALGAWFAQVWGPDAASEDANCEAAPALPRTDAPQQDGGAVVVSETKTQIAEADCEKNETAVTLSEAEQNAGNATVSEAFAISETTSGSRNTAKPESTESDDDRAAGQQDSEDNAPSEAAVDRPQISTEERIRLAAEAEKDIALSDADRQLIVRPEVELELDALSVVNCALEQNRMPMLRAAKIINRSDKPLDHLELRIVTVPGFALSLRKPIDYISENSSLTLEKPQLALNAEYLVGLTERVQGQLCASLYADERQIASRTLNITVLAFDEWHGSGFYPELLAAFVMPNHPEIARLTARAAQLLEEWSGDPSLDAYQSHDVNRVLLQAAAVFGAIQEQNIVYAVAPSSFERAGQRVRLCDQVLRQKMGNCLELTLLYSACLEAIGLHPLLVLNQNHAYAGLWLDDLVFPESAQDDPSLLTKRMAEGVSEIALVECTLLTAAHQDSFDAARTAAEKNITGIEDFDCVIDVNRARLSGILPLPLRIQTADGWRVDRPHLDRDALTAAPQSFSNPLKIDDRTQVFEHPRLAQWDRKLLDLGLRNSLISLKPTKTLIPILTSSPEELENALSGGSDFSIAPRPTDWVVGEDKLGFDGLHRPAEQTGVLQAEFKNKRLRSTLGEEELNASVKELYRAARLSLEENGANTLYLAIGLLKWYETDRSTKPRYAPLILLPVELVRRSAKQGYVLRLRDEEPQMNITILEKLKQDFDVAVPSLDPLPLDDHGVDVRRVFTVLRKSIMSQPRWDVLESAYLGTFSFSQFVMWNDIHSRADDLMRSKIVRSLIDGKLNWEAEDMAPGEFIDESGVLLPIPADASQLFAIRAACEGTTFVLHGPPGTGKSQTITALIANALAQGKTVLFVAEKMAALEVVQKRLSAIGIAPFCLELHSNKSKKRDLLDQLRAASEVTRNKTSEEYERRADEIAKLRGELDGYAHALHAVQPCGLTAFELISRCEAAKDARDIAPFGAELLEKITPEQLAAQEDLVQRLISAAEIVGHPVGHPLAAIRCPQYSQQLKASLPKLVADYRNALTQLRTASDRFADAIGEPAPASSADLQRLNAIAAELSFWITLPKDWASLSRESSFLISIARMSQHYLKAAKLREELSALWHDSFFQLNGYQLMTESDAIRGKWAVARAFAERGFHRRILMHAKGAIASDAIPGQLTKLSLLQREASEGQKLFDVYGHTLGAAFGGTEAEWRRLAAAVTRIAEHQNTAAIELPERIRIELAGEKHLESEINALNTAVSDFGAACNAIDSALYIAPCDDADWIAGQQKLCDAIDAHRDALKEWFAWNGVAAEAEAHGLAPVVEAIREGIPLHELPAAYRKSVSRSLAEHAIISSAALDCFSGASFNEQIEQFMLLDKRLQELAKEEIFCRLAAKVPSFAREAAQSSELGILQRAIRSGGRGVSIRRLFEQIPNLLPRLCPCMLMSPISAAQYLAPNREPFDLVVFDEASQLPTCKSIGVLARGKDAVIVGDPKQMPPTSFFESNRTDDENLEAEDLESILDDCLALSMPQTHLLWHYRSRHESLIAYSNQAFYDNRLYTFPSVNDREMKVRLVPVDGQFDRGRTRTNRSEADAIIAELKRRCHDPELSKLSVGVVTFNISQQHLIDDLLTDACKADPALEAWAYSSDEPVFIKNLENVQGDERDVILFSVSFGADANNRVSMNFGPLNREGGWRRLNVAITRARHEMIVFSTLKPGQINLSRTSAQGVAALKGFLEYASGQPLPEPPEIQRRHAAETPGIARSICATLREHGYAAETDVGHSEYRVDIGVIDPDDPARYLLGILLDGESYGAARTTRDREIAQIGVLNGLGWQLLRVWSMDWWDNSRKEAERILEVLAALRKPGNDPDGSNNGSDGSDSSGSSNDDMHTASDNGETGAHDIPVPACCDKTGECGNASEASASEKDAGPVLPDAASSAELTVTTDDSDLQAVLDTLHPQNASTSDSARSASATNAPSITCDNTYPEVTLGSDTFIVPDSDMDILASMRIPTDAERPPVQPERPVLLESLSVAPVAGAAAPLSKPDEILPAASIPVEGESTRKAEQKKASLHTQSVSAEAMPAEPSAAEPYFAAVLKYTPVTQEALLSSDYDRMLERKIDMILLAEAPVSEAVLRQRLLDSCGISRAGSKLQERIDALIRGMCLRTTCEDDRRFFWNAPDNPDDYSVFRVSNSAADRREPKDIPLQEAANAVCQALADQISLPDDALLREAGKLMGFSRTGTSIVALFQNAVDYAAGRGRIIRASNGNWILKKL